MGEKSRWKRGFLRADFLFLAGALLLPLVDFFLPSDLKIGSLMLPVFIFAMVGLGLNIVTGFTGLLNLGAAAFMAIGAYAFAILTCDIYPFRFDFWVALAAAPLFGAAAGLALGSPTLRLRGDYLAIATLGFGEIIQDVLRNLDTITKGTQGINPLPPPSLGGYSFAGAGYYPWYFLFLGMLALAVVFNRHVENSRLGRAWVSIREDELAASCMGINTVKAKLLAFALGGALCSFGGALWASMLGSTGEPGNYDFAVSIMALCIVIIGGAGNISGVLFGAIAVVGLDSIVLVKLSKFLSQKGLASGANVFSSPTNWKFLIFGLALILMMRFRPEGLLPSSRVKAELHEGEEDRGEPVKAEASSP